MLYPAELRARETAILSYSAGRGMLRNPFVWEVQVRREVLEQEVARLRELPYSLWHDTIGRQVCKSARGRDNRTYPGSRQLGLGAAWIQGHPRHRRARNAGASPAADAPELRDYA